MSSLIPAVEALARRFLERTVMDLQTLHSLLEQARSQPSHALARVARIAHSIHGTGASLGCREISDCAKILEQRVKQYLTVAEGPLPSPDELHAMVCQLDLSVTQALTRLNVTAGTDTRNP